MTTEENVCEVNGRRLVAVDCKNADTKCNECSQRTENINECLKAKPCTPDIRADHRNIVWKLETEVNETMENANV